MKQGTEDGAVERWWQEHSALGDMVTDFVQALDGGSLSEARAAYEELNDTLDAHFSVEETSYFPLVLELLPVQGEQVQSALEGHEAARKTLHAIGRRLSDDDLASVPPLLRELLDGFRRHEDVEAGIIADMRRSVERARPL